MTLRALFVPAGHRCGYSGEVVTPTAAAATQPDHIITGPGHLSSPVTNGHDLWHSLTALGQKGL